jgi:hypothetical protein
VWSLLYGLAHLYWGLGGTAGHQIYKPSADDESIWAIANLFAFVLMAFAGVLGFALLRASTPSLLRLGLLGIIGAGSAIAASHGAFGIAFRAASVLGISDVDGVPFDVHEHAWVLWDMLVIEPWFLVEGLLLGLVGYQAQTSPHRRKLWLWSMVGAFVVALATGVLGLRFA